MNDDDRELLARHMAAMAADAAMVVPFLDDFGGRVRGLVRHYLHDLARPDLARDADEVDGLVMDVAFVLAERAASWRPGGALPWVWAGLAIRAEIGRSIGHRQADLEIERLDTGDLPRGGAAAFVVPDPAEMLTSDRPVADDAGSDDLAALADRLGDPRLQLLLEAIGEAVASLHQREVYVEFRVQKLQGDPSPAETLAPRYGLSAVNVRQIASRSHRKVRALVDTDDRYLDLRDLGWFAA